MDLVEKFLDLYELTSYYQVEEAFLSFRVLEAFASKITNDMLCEWHSHIGHNVSDKCLPEKVVQFLRIRPRRIFSHPDRGKSSDRPGEDLPPEEVEQEAGRVASKVTCEMQQQAIDARLQPLIESGRCKRNFSRNKKRICFECCNNPLLHPEEECEYFLGLPVVKRKDLCRKGNRCYKCLTKGHESKVCPSPRDK